LFSYVNSTQIMNKIVLITSLLMGAVLSRFAISKLAAWEISVRAFEEMAQPIHVDPTLFRQGTGILIALIVLGYFCTALFQVFYKKLPHLTLRLSLLFQVLGLLTMVGALLSEFLLRVSPKWILVYIALGIIVLSTINIGILLQQKTRNHAS